MRYLFFLFTIAVAVFAWVDEDGRDSSIPEGTVPAGGAAITLTVLDTFQVSSANYMLGLDTMDGSDELVIMDNVGGFIRGVEMGTGNPEWTIDSPTDGSFGCCHNWPAPYGWYANGFWFEDNNMYYYDGSTWSIVFENPAGFFGRGMDFQNDGNYIWQNASFMFYH